MDYLSKFGVTDFIVCLGYKSEYARRYFSQLCLSFNDVTVFGDGSDPINHTQLRSDWEVTLLDTGLKSLTGRRLWRIKEYIEDERFFLTYGDGVSNINISDLIEFHDKSGSLCTLTAVRPVARFGELELDASGSVKSFVEKNQLAQGWINGGYMIMEPSIFEFMNDSNEMLETGLLQRLSAKERLSAFRHDDFWQCMDNKRDKEMLEAIWETGDAPWK